MVSDLEGRWDLLKLLLELLVKPLPPLLKLLLLGNLPLPLPPLGGPLVESLSLPIV